MQEVCLWCGRHNADNMGGTAARGGRQTERLPMTKQTEQTDTAAVVTAERERLGDATAHTGRGAAAASDAVQAAQEVIRAAASVAYREHGLARRSSTTADDIAQEVSVRIFADLA